MNFVELLLSVLATLAVGGAIASYFFYCRESPKKKFARPSLQRTTSSGQGTPNKNKRRNKGKMKKKPMGGISKKSTFSKSIGGTRTKGGKHALLVGTLPGQTENIYDMAWSPNGKIVATLDQAGHIRVFTGISQCGEGQLSATVSTFDSIQGADRALCMPSDDLILVGMVRKRVGFVRIRKAKDKKVTFEKYQEVELELSFDIVKMVAAKHPSLGTICFMYDAGSDYIESISVENAKSHGRMKIKQGEIHDIALSPDGKLLLVCTARQANVFCVKPGQHCCLAKPSGTNLGRPGTDLNNKAVFSAGFTPKVNRIVAAGMDRKLMSYQSDIAWLSHESPKLLNQTPIENMKKKEVDLVTVLDENTVALSIGPVLQFYDVKANVLLAEVPNAAKFAKCKLSKIVWNPERNLLCTCGNDKRVTFWKRP